MEPARNTRMQVSWRKCHFLRLPAELRNTIYEMVLIQDEPIVFRDSKRFPKDPPLLSTCKQIRAEASGIYGKNRLEISLLSFDITKVTNWMRLSPPRVALYEKSEIGLTTFGGNWGVNGPPGGNPWQNLLTWVELYYQRRCRRIVFDMVEELLKKGGDMTLAKLLKAVGIYRRTMLRLR